MDETDSLDISALTLEGAIRADLRGEDMGGMEMLLLPCVGTFWNGHAAGYKVGVS